MKLTFKCHFVLGLPSGSSLGNVKVHFFTLFYTPGSPEIPTFHVFRNSQNWDSHNFGDP